MHKTSIWYFLIALYFYSSCKPITALKKTNAQTAEYQKWTNDNKEVIFIPMAHISTREFYSDVKRLIDSFKLNNYTIYYEGLTKVIISDSVLQDEYLRKFRKMLGFYMDTTGYTEYFNKQGLFKNKVGQPRPSMLGIDSTDHNVDVSLVDLVNQYENKYGKIKLDIGDYQLALSKNSGYVNSLRLPKKKVETVIIGFRNSVLASYIQNSSDKKIVVIYGLWHIKGTFEELKDIDQKWRKTS